MEGSHMAPAIRHTHADRPTRPRRVGPAIATILVSTALVVSLGPSIATADVKFGAHVEPRSGEDLTQAMRRFENQVGHKLGAARVYYRWDSFFPSPYARWLKQTGHRIYMSVKALRTNNTYVPWKKIASARKGSTVYRQIVKWAVRIKRFGAPVHFIFNHEPEGGASDRNGSARAFKRAWRKIHTVFRQKGARNVIWLWTMTAWAFEATDGKRAGLWYPGNRYVDEVGATAYNWHTCTNRQSWEPLASSLDGVRRFGRRHRGKELVLTEWGSVEDWSSPGRKANWIDGARATFKRDEFRQFDALLYFHAQVSCTWFADTTDSAMNAFRRMAGDSFYD